MITDKRIAALAGVVLVLSLIVLYTYWPRPYQLTTSEINRREELATVMVSAVPKDDSMILFKLKDSISAGNKMDDRELAWVLNFMSCPSRDKVLSLCYAKGASVIMLQKSFSSSQVKVIEAKLLPYLSMTPKLLANGYDPTGKQELSLIKMYTVGIFSSIGDKAAIPAMLPLLHDENKSVSQLTQKRLVNLGYTDSNQKN